jgi:gliding motility-associated-like protein
VLNVFRAWLLLLIGFCVLAPLSLRAQDPCNGLWFCTPTGTGVGSQADPTSLTFALANAAAPNTTIRLATGDYVLNAVLALPSGFSLEGGYNATTWRKASNGVTRLLRNRNNAQTNPLRLVAVEALNQTFFSIRDINIEVQDADTLINGYGASVYGLYLSGCSDYVLSRVNVTAGNATKGRPGQPVLVGRDGANGADGGKGCRQCDSTNTTFNPFGGSAGNSWSVGIAAGGRGGNGTLRGNNSGRVLTVEGAIFGSQNICPPQPVVPVRAQNGGNGATNSSASAGLGGPASAIDKDFILDYGCSISFSDALQIGIDAGDFFLNCPTDNDGNFGGLAGTTGGNGGPGANGNNGIPQFSGGFFVPGDGSNGVRGEHGAGGGGGGGGGGSYINIPRLNSLIGGPITTPGPQNASPGAGGGGGGEGGEGGAGGEGGGGGGSSFGIFIWNNGTNGEIRDCQYTAGAFGLGSSGSLGRNGGLGGDGGLGGFDCRSIGSCAGGCEGGRGGDGRRGGNGGRGGDGGQGADGVAQDLYQNFSGIPITPTNVRVPFETPILVQNSGCSKSDVLFVIPNSDPAVTYQWSFGSDATPLTAVGDSVVAQFGLTGNKTIVLTQNGIPFRYTQFLNLNVTGVDPIISLANGENDSVCLNQTVFLLGDYVPNSATVLETEWITTGPGVNAIQNGVANFSYTTPPLTSLGVYKTYYRVRSTCCGWSLKDSITLTVIPTLSPGLTVVAPLTELCPGTPVIIQAFPAQVGPDAPTYLWRRNGVTEDTNNNPVYTPPILNNGDVMEVWMVPNYICLTTDTVKSSPIAFTVYPPVNVTCNPIAPRRLGNPTTLSATITSGTSPYSYVWDLGNGFTSAGNSTTGVISDNVQYGGPGTYNVTLTVTDNNGCTSTCTQTADIQNFTVLTGDYTVNIQDGCDTLSVTFTGSGNATTFTYDFGDGTTGVGSPITHFYTARDTFYTVSMVASDNLGANPPVTRVNYIRVYPRPVAGITVVGNRICANEPVVLAATGSGDYLYSWDLGNGTTATTPVVFARYAEGVYRVILRSANANNFCFDLDTLNLIVRGQPNAAFAGSLVSVNNCEPATYYFENQSTTTSGTIAGYYWQFGQVDTSTQTSPTYTFPRSGTFNVQLVAYSPFGCRDTATKPIDVRPQPVALFVPADTALTTPDNFTTFSNNTIYGPGTTFEWTFQGGSPATSTNFDPGTVTFEALRRCYIVTLVATDPLGCADTATSQICVRPAQKVYVPNVFTPNGDGLNDNFNILSEGYEYTILVFDRWGRELFKGDRLNFWNGRVNNTGPDVPEGAYAWRLSAFNFNNNNTYVLAGTVTVLR